MPNEIEKFLEDTAPNPSQVDVLTQPLNPETPAKEPEDGTTGTESTEDDETRDGKPRNRRERRLMEKLQAERESSMFLAGKLEAREEARRSVTEEADYLKGIERIYGTDTPEAQIATDLLKKAIVGARSDAKREAIEELRSERQREQEDVRKADTELDNMVEEIEDTYGVTLNPTQERAFFTMLTKMSPKDRDGNVVNYADPHAVWEVFAERLKKPSSTTTQAKDLASRSMTQSGASTGTQGVQMEATERFLRDQGIIQ